MSKDYYKVLGIDEKASQDEIKKAYRKLAHQCHPDKKGGDEAKFKEVNEAYQTLSDDKKRSQYDQFGSGHEQGGASGFGGFGGGQGAGGFQDFNFQGGGFEDIFSDFFGGGQATKKQTAGSDVVVDVDIDFKEMARGVNKKIKLYKKIICKTCDGTGAKNKNTKQCSACGGSGQIKKIRQTFLGNFSQIEICNQCKGKGQIAEEKCRECGGDGVIKDYQEMDVNIPAGIDSEQVLKVSGGGEASSLGGPTGDLYLKIHIRPHSEFKRKGSDVVSKKNINFSQAVLGDKIEVETVEGLVKLKIPAGIEAGDFLRIKGKGIKNFGGFGQGNHLVEIKIKTPKKISWNQKNLIQKLQKEGI